MCIIIQAKLYNIVLLLHSAIWVCLYNIIMPYIKTIKLYDIVMSLYYENHYYTMIATKTVCSKMLGIVKFIKLYCIQNWIIQFLIDIFATPLK